jgi:hypothetical protein
VKLHVASLLSVVFIGGMAAAQSTESGMDLQKVSAYFQEAQDLCTRDGGVLWGKSLCVPMAFIDPQSRQVVTNRQDSAGKLTRNGELYVGVWPDTLPIANSSVIWSGTRWTTLMWPMPEDKIARTELMMHECFHNIEGELGFPSMIPANAHLDSREGRTWMRLEWRALKAALTSSANARKQAVTDALVFREYRRGQFPGSADTERTLEMHEGLAEYTGVKLSGLAAGDIPSYVAGDLYQSRTNTVSFISSFAYWSGPAYGTLLDELGLAWRKNLTPDNDLGMLLQAAMKITLPANLAMAVDEAAARYDGSTVKSEELAREQEHNRILAACRARFVDGPVLILPLMQMNLQYDPRGMVSMDSLGTVYATIRISDVWGIVEVTGRGALMAPTWNALRIPAPTDLTTRPLAGEGWTLQLNDGWEVTPATRAGDFMLRPKQ